MKNQEFNCHTYGECDSYLSIPRLLMTHPIYKTLSSEAKIVYSLLLEKQSDCRKNNWYDKENRGYVLFPDYKMQEILNISSEQLMKTYSELDTENGIGLLERQIQELDKPTRIFLKKFHHINTADVEILRKNPITEPPSKEEYYAKLKEFEGRNTDTVIPFYPMGV